MKLHELAPPAGSHRAKQRIGRGIAAGQGKTSGKGQKGQKSRTGSSIPRTFEGGQLPLTQRLPKLRGFNNKWRKEYAVVNLSKLGRFAPGTLIDLPALVKERLIPRNAERVKVLGEGGVEQKLTLRVDRISKSAMDAVEKAGGSVEVTEAPKVRRIRDRKKKANNAPVKEEAEEATEAPAAKAEAPAKAEATEAPAPTVESSADETATTEE